MEKEIKEKKVQSSTFAVLNAINCNEHTEKKNGMTYLSWAWAWQIVKQNFPDATYTIYEWQNAMGCPQNYFTDGRTAWVKTGVTIGGIEHIEELPVMDYKNASIGIDRVTSFDVNKAIQRSLTKAVARHGLGLYIYAGEDLPDKADDDKRNQLKVTDQNLELAMQEAKEAPNEEALNDVYRRWKNAYGQDSAFLTACSNRKQELLKAQRG